MGSVIDSWRGGGTGRGAYLLEATAASQIPLRVRGAAGQTADLLQVLNSADVVQFGVGPSGNLTIAGDITAVVSQTLTGNISLTGNLTVNGNSTLGDASGDTLTVNATATFAAGATFSSTTAFNGTARFNAQTSASVHYLRRLSAAPATTADSGGLYTATGDTGTTELFFLDAAGNTVQITDAGSLEFGAIDGMMTFDSGEVVTAASYQIGRDADGTNQIHFNVPTGASFEFSVNDTAELVLNATNLQPGTNDGLALGVSGTAFSDLFLASGAVINFDAGDVTITHAANQLSFGGGNFAVNGYVVLGGGVTTPDVDFTLQINRVFTGTASNAVAHLNIGGGITEASSGTHSTIAGLSIDGITVTDGAGTEVITNLASLYIEAAPTAGTTPVNGPYALFVDAGNSRFDGDVLVSDGAGIVIGNSAQITTGFSSIPEMQVLGTAEADASAIIGRFSADAYPSNLFFVKSRNATIGSNTIVLDNDIIGYLGYYPDDGADFQTEAASFQAEVDDATPAAGDIGMAFVWQSMAGGGAALAERMRLSAAGELTMGNDVKIRHDVNAGLTASTTQTQGNGALTAEVNEVAIVANANDTVTLPTAVAGLRIVIINNGANTLRIFPASGDNLGAGVDTATTLASGSNVVYQAYDATNYEAI